MRRSRYFGGGGGVTVLGPKKNKKYEGFPSFVKSPKCSILHPSEIA